MPEDTVRVLRIIEYVGPRSLIEAQLARSMGDGTKEFSPRDSNGRIVSIRIATVGAYPDILNGGN